MFVKVLGVGADPVNSEELTVRERVLIVSGVCRSVQQIVVGICRLGVQVDPEVA